MSAGFWDFCVEEDIQGAYRVVDNMAFRFQEYTPPPQYQNPTPQPSESVTTLDEIKELFSNGFLETARAMQELKEEIAATGIALVSKLNALDTRIGIVEEQLDQEIEVTESQQGTLPMYTIVEDEMERIDSEPAVSGAEFGEEINLQPLLECVDTIEEDLGAAEGEEATSDFVEEPSTVDAVQTTLVVQEEMPTSDDDPLKDQPVKEIGNAEGSELRIETNDISTAATCHDSNSSFSAEDLTTKDTTEYAATLSSDIFESAAMPQKGPDKPEDHTVSQLDRVVHNDIGDSLAKRWSMSKKGNGFPWDDGISKELKLSNDPVLNGQDFWVSNLLKPPLLFDHKSRGFLVKDGGTPAGIPRSGPDIPSYYEFDQSQFLRFAGKGGCISYCDIIGSVTRPPEILHNVPVLC